MGFVLRFKYLRFLVRLKNYFDIKASADREATVSVIRRDVYLKGSNIWYLICSALIASIGLDINSEAVIIGGMLISPLMTPILGIGLSYGIHDKELLLISLKEFIAAVFISLAVSVSMNRTQPYYVLVLGNKITKAYLGVRENLSEINNNGFPVYNKFRQMLDEADTMHTNDRLSDNLEKDRNYFREVER